LATERLHLRLVPEEKRDAVTIATSGPDAPREFFVSFGLTPPGTKIVIKVYG